MVTEMTDLDFFEVTKVSDINDVTSSAWAALHLHRTCAGLKQIARVVLFRFPR